MSKHALFHHLLIPLSSGCPTLPSSNPSPTFNSAAIAAKDKVYGTNSPRLLRAVGMAYSSSSKGTSCSNRVTSKRSVSSFLNTSKTISSPRQHSSPKPSCPLVTCEAVKTYIQLRVRPHRTSLSEVATIPIPSMNLIAAIAAKDEVMPEERTVTIPAREQHAGQASITVTLPWIYQQCDGPRGEPYSAISRDGSLQLAVHSWINPAGMSRNTAKSAAIWRCSHDPPCSTSPGTSTRGQGHK